MKKQSKNSVFLPSLFSALVLGLFAVLATGSLEVLQFWEIEVTRTHIEGDVYKEKEFHHSNGQQIVTEGPQDPQGRWNGWVTITYSKVVYADEYEERVYMLHGRRQGLCTRTYPDGSQEEEHYLNGQKIDLKKAAGSELAEGTAFQLLQQRYPWFLFVMEAFTYDNQYVENYLDTLEMLLGVSTFDVSEFDNYFDQVQSDLSQTPYDSIVESVNSLIGSFGYQKMKNDELRLAVLEKHRSGGTSTYGMLESSYHNYIVTMSMQGVSSEDLMAFCMDLDDSLSLFVNPDPEDPFFVDSVDTHFFQAFTSIYGGTKKKALLPDHRLEPDRYRNSFNEIPKPQGTNLTPAEVAEIAAGVMFEKFYEVDLMRQCVYDSYLTGKGIAYLPTAATEFVKVNSATSVTLRGSILDDGGNEVAARGIAWAAYNNPGLSDPSIGGGSGTGSFEVTLDGLTEGETYYARTYAVNDAGVAYGNQVSFVPESTVGIAYPQSTEHEFVLYPNPASSAVTISFRTDSDNDMEAVLVDMSGRILQRETLRGSVGTRLDITLDVSGLPEGHYRCQILDNGLPVEGKDVLIIH